jgi:uncharacterized membrane protein YhaH (DUF805 family)
MFRIPFMAGELEMDWKYIFFSFQGRLRRRDFWVATLISYAVLIVMVGIVGAIRGVFGVGSLTGSLASMALVFVVEMAWVVFAVWAGIAVSVKRCHDRNQSGWWILLQLVPILGQLWALINLGILDGTPGDNQFGPSPKSGPGQSEVFA